MSFYSVSEFIYNKQHPRASSNETIFNIYKSFFNFYRICFISHYISFIVANWNISTYSKLKRHELYVSNGVSESIKTLKLHIPRTILHKFSFVLNYFKKDKEEKDSKMPPT